MYLMYCTLEVPNPQIDAINQSVHHVTMPIHCTDTVEWKVFPLPRFATRPWITVQIFTLIMNFWSCHQVSGASPSSQRAGPHESPATNTIGRWAVAQTCTRRWVHVQEAASMSTMSLSPPGPAKSITMMETGRSGQNAKLVCSYKYGRSTGVKGHPTFDLSRSKRKGIPYHGIISSNAVYYKVNVHVVRFADIKDAWNQYCCLYQRNIHYS
jgi:hypothetical protein